MTEIRIGADEVLKVNGLAINEKLIAHIHDLIHFNSIPEVRMTLMDGLNDYLVNAKEAERPIDPDFVFEIKQLYKIYHLAEKTVKLGNLFHE